MKDIERQKCFLIRLAYLGAIGGLVFVLLRYGLPMISPFVVAFLIAFLLRHPIRFLSGRCHIKKSAVAIVLVLLCYAVIGLLLSLAGIKLVASVKQLVSSLPGFYVHELLPALRELFLALEGAVSRMDPTLLTTLQEMFYRLTRSLGEMISGMSVRAVAALSGYASALPGGFIRLVLMIISTFFIAVDYDELSAFALRQLPEQSKALALEIKSYVLGTLLACVRSYALIMSITFVELAVGLTLIGIKNAVAIALMIAFFDVLPVLGTGGIMIPWTILTALQGDFPKALGLLVVYLVVTVIRNVIEPKIVGGQVGLHPVVTLICMSVGVQLLGVLGLFGFPIALSLLKNLNDKGTIRLFR
ncbi:MAG: sporulation integral membrane protein YtvI [Oscillospiraceae bacterium]